MRTPIEDYGMIGDGHTAALVGKNGSIDWLCWPNFGSDACFASLLGGQSNGFWLLTPLAEIKSMKRRYRPDTLILETTFETEGGRVTLIDFMPPHTRSSNLIRIVRCDEGEVALCMELMLRFGYGATTPWVTRLEDGTMRAVAGPDMAVLRTPAFFRGENFKTVAMFTLTKGNSMPFVLSYGPSHLDPPAPVVAEEALAASETFWRDWTATTKAEGPYRDAIVRSLITLKGLVYKPSGGIVAAPTTSLPEHFGSERNWDYRLCWLRDSTLTLLAMMNAGIYDEAAAWRDWLHRAVAGSPDEMQIMYGLRGERRLTEWEVDWLPGYADSKPVRIGNAAHEQFQLDVYGELMDSFEQARKGGLASTDGGWEMQRTLLAHVADIWDKPDSGIWESRGPLRHYVYSKAMAWVCFDRGIKAVEKHGLK
jgi:GH15 family glucan-1,4-alpha-glucosidase